MSSPKVGHRPKTSLILAEATELLSQLSTTLNSRIQRVEGYDDSDDDDVFCRAPTPPLPPPLLPVEEVPLEEEEDDGSASRDTNVPSATSDAATPTAPFQLPVELDERSRVPSSNTSTMSLDPYRKADLLARATTDRWRLDAATSADAGDHMPRPPPPRPCAPPPLAPPPKEALVLAHRDVDRHDSLSTVDTISAPPSMPQSPGQPPPPPHAMYLTTPANSQRKRTPEDFIVERNIGEGSYSTVMLATEKGTTNQFALKILDKRHIVKEKKIKYVDIEKRALTKLRHPLIIRLYYTFHDTQSLYFALELATNGELLTWLRKLGSFDVLCARFYAAELAQAIDYMHSQGVIHRDLKPENILLDERMHIKLADFGTAKLFDTADGPDDVGDDERANSFVGTAEYVSPELLTNKIATRSCDWWAFGCIVYQLLAGRPPFKAANEYLTFQKIIKLEYTFPEGFPSEAQDLIEQLLVIDPEKRLGSGPNGMEQLRSHPFFADLDWDAITQQVPPRLLPYLPPIANHNQEELRSDSSAMLFQPDRHCPATPQLEGEIIFEDDADVPEEELQPQPVDATSADQRATHEDGIEWEASPEHMLGDDVHASRQLHINTSSTVCSSAPSIMSAATGEGADDEGTEPISDSLAPWSPRRANASFTSLNDAMSISRATSHVSLHPLSHSAYTDSSDTRFETAPLRVTASAHPDQRRHTKSPALSATSHSLSVLSHPFIPQVLHPGERAVMAGFVYKRRGLFSKRRLLVLTDQPRLIYTDDHRGRIKGVLTFTASMLPEFKDSRHFFIHTPSKTHYFEDVSRSARLWVDTINQVIKDHIGDTV